MSLISRQLYIKSGLLVILSCTLFASPSAASHAAQPGMAILIADASASASGASYSSAAPISFTDRNNQYWQANPHPGTEEKALNQTPESGQDPPDQFQPNTYGETKPSGQAASLTDQSRPTTAKQAPPKQNATHPLPVQKEFCVYPNPLQNNYGPPTGPVYHHWPMWEGGPKTVDGGLNPAFSTDLPPCVQKGAPPSDLVSNLSSLTAAKRQADEQLTTNFHSAQAQAQSQTQSAGEAAHASTQAQLSSNLSTVQTSLINVANENAGTPVVASAPTKTLSQAIWMVQQMYKHIFIPLALLLILPGAVLSQMFSVIGNSGLTYGTDEAANPFTGILRGLVAIFLIPATQVIVSYGIDVGNSSTAEITNFIQVESIMNWTQPMTNPYGGMQPMQKENAQKDQTSAGALMDTGLGTIQMLLSNALMVLAAYQVVLACYLFLFGPISAAFLAWPSTVGGLFKPVFSKWLQGLLNLVMWRFWWCVIVLIMTTRLQWLQQSGQPIDGPWEKLVFTAFTVMLVYVPFNSLDFSPGAMVDQLLAKTNGGKGD
jgi:hypothetical protein